MKHIIFFIALLVILTKTFAQEPYYTNVSGIVLDSTYHPIEYVAVQLFSKQQTGKKYAGMTDETGNYLIKKIPAGNYKFVVSAFGYESFTKNIELKEIKNNKLGLVILKLNNLQLLDEVEIKGTKATIKKRVDKTVFVPDSTMLRSTKTGLDVLKKIPEISVKNNQEISVLGNKNVLILINGMDHNRSIQSIHPDEIKEIELITSPSVKYDSEVAAVINIILKSYKQKGFSLSSNFYSCVDRKRITGNLQLNYNIGKWNFFLSYNGNYNRQKSLDSIKRIDYAGSTNIVYDSYPISENISDVALTGFQYGFDYILNKKNLISFTSKIDFFSVASSRNMRLFSFENNDPKSQSDIGSLYDSDKTEMNYSLYYLHRFKNTKEKLSINTNYYVLNADTKHFINNQTTILATNADYVTQRNIFSFDKQYSLNTKIDYTKPVTDKFSIETGLQFYYRKIDNDKKLSDVEQNRLLYSDNRNSFYLNTTYQKSKWAYQLGVRIEHFSIDVEKKQNNQTKILPYVAVLHKFDSKNSLKFIYKKSLKYPIYTYLNPFKYYASDSLTYFAGNPYLKPEEKNILSLNYAFKKKQKYLSVGLKYNYLSNLITQQTVLNNGILAYTYENIANAHQYEIYLSGSSTFFDWLEIELLLKAAYTDFLTNKAHSGYDYMAEYSLYFPIFLDIDVEIYGTFKERETNYYGYSEYGAYIDEILFSKDITDNLTFGLGVWEPFIQVIDKEKTWGKTFMESDKYIQLQTPSYMFNLTYYIRSGKKRKKIKKELLIEKNQSKGKTIK